MTYMYDIFLCNELKREKMCAAAHTLHLIEF
jgi:hypothetical protein